MAKRVYFGGLKNAVYNQGVGLALGGGGLRFFFHVGVLKAIDEHNIPVKLIAGTSAGSIAGAMYASGMSGLDIEELSMTLNTSSFITLGSPKLSRKGILRAKGIVELLEETLKDNDFASLQIPFYAVATDLLTGSKVIFDEGPVTLAVRSSISVPAVFEPVVHENMVLVDGGVLQNLPLSIVYDHWKGPVFASWLTPPVEMKSISIKTKKHPLTFLKEYVPFLKSWSVFDQPEIQQLKADMLSILMRSWDVASTKQQIDEIEAYRPDLLITFDPEMDFGMDANQKNIAALIRDGYDNAIKRFKESKII